jgi:hypothetical protein
MGFVLNSYDTCVANKRINGTVCTIIWHVDDLKISHVDPEIVSEIISDISKKYGKLQVSRGKVHEYLGMTINFSQPKTVQVIMTQYVKKLVEDAEEKFKGNAVTPAKNNLFIINNLSPYLSVELSQFFHTITAKLLFLAK